MIDEVEDENFQLRHQGMAPEIDGIIYATLSTGLRLGGKKNYQEGDLVRVRIIDASGYDLIGQIL
ncbi:MAG: hypothetical protein A2Y62_00595 [Candidatus Fischerbacteria bacterium RBG_13_37_8]|uniref:TRAM domain-containing protein n=1 Tax=Candidatus Fischerbacteria bacterium RBG_13_37_8 TaxID=1817863 RepID=A0A1F5VPJ7_9BACT|nr:MAG: hypothetical protein A2Y62_00595 [Candidatus Fischerbacteria bacterium RBG_13_37_8]